MSITKHVEERILPQNIDFERQILGTLIVDGRQPDTIAQVHEKLEPLDFYEPAHHILYQAILSIYGAGNPVDSISLSAELRRTSNLAEAGGLGYIAELMNYGVLGMELDYLCDIIREKSAARIAISAYERAIEGLYDDKLPANKVVEDSEQRIFNAFYGRGSEDIKSLNEIMEATIERIIEESASDKKYSVTTGWVPLDDLIGGFYPGDLIIAAARTSKGKTAFALNIAKNIAISMDNGCRPVGIFSLEMTDEVLCCRLNSMYSDVESYKMRFRKVTSEEDKSKIREAVEPFKVGKNILTSDANYLTPMKLRSKARLMKMLEPNLSLIIVDYLQLVDPGEKFDREDQGLREISHSLKRIAHELNVPILALSQFTKAIDTKPGQEPTLGDLYGSVALSQDADLVVLLHHSSSPQDANDIVPIECIVAKNRNGATGNVNLNFNKSLQTFTDNYTRAN